MKIINNVFLITTILLFLISSPVTAKNTGNPAPVHGTVHTAVQYAQSQQQSEDDFWRRNPGLDRRDTGDREEGLSDIPDGTADDKEDGSPGDDDSLDWVTH